MSGDGGPSDPRPDPGDASEADPQALTRRIARSTDSDEIKRSIARRGVARGRSIRAIAEEFGWSERRLGELLQTAEGDRSSDSHTVEESPRSPGWWSVDLPMGELVVAGLVALILLVFLQSGLLLGVRAAAMGVYADLVEEPVPPGDDSPLTISRDDVTYLNRIFEEQDDEVGYCGLIDRDRRMRPWLAELGESTRSSVEVSVDNCPIGRYEGLALLHTHPNGDSRLTSADRSTLEVADVDYVCVQHGPITASVGERTTQLRCYASGEPTGNAPTTRRVPVSITA